MIVGLFGLSGSGKTHLTSSFCSKYEAIATRASQIIKEYGHTIEYSALDSNVVNSNQPILIRGLSRFRQRYPSATIIIELHNVIETPKGVIEIDSQVLFDLNLDAVCFLDVSPELLSSYRKNDSIKERPDRTLTELKVLQLISLKRFRSDFESSIIPSITLKSEPLSELEVFLRPLINLHPKGKT